MLNHYVYLPDRYCWFTAGLFAIFCYTAVVIVYAINIPFADDLAVLSSINEFQRANGLAEHAKNLFSFHNEHRIAIPRILTILLFYIQGRQISFISWILTGNACIVGILYILYRVSYSRVRFVFFLPVVLFLLQPMHYELMYWGMASIQNLSVILLACLSFYFLLVSDNPYIALLCAVAATFTSANGIFTFICCIGLLAYRKQYRTAVLWFVVAIILSKAYWSGFSSIYSAGQSLQIDFPLSVFFPTFFSFAGGLVYLQKLPILSLVAGTLFITFLVRVVYFKLIKEKNNDTHLLFILSCVLFILLTMAAISFHRNSESISLVSRYKLYPALLVVLLYSMLLNYVTRNRYFFNSVLLVSLIFALFSYIRFIPRFKQHNDLLLTHFFNWKQTNRLESLTQIQQHYYSENWLRSLQNGQYIIPEYAHIFYNQILTQARTKPVVKLSYTEDDSRVYLTPVLLPTGTYYLIRKDKKSMMIYPMLPAYPTSPLAPATSTNLYAMATTKEYWLSDQQATSQIVIIP